MGLNLTSRMFTNKALKNLGFRCQVELRNLTYANFHNKKAVAFLGSCF